jgi:hypothetical protein
VAFFPSGAGKHKREERRRGGEKRKGKEDKIT